MIRITKGLDIPITGAPQPTIDATRRVRSVGLVGDDHVGMKPTLTVAVGDRVRLGQALYEDKKNRGVVYTAPGAGIVTAIHRGPKRAFESLVIELDGDEEETFRSFDAADLSALDPADVRQNLLRSGLWTALRARPFGRTPASKSPPPHSIFVTAMDTNPLAPAPEPLIQEHGYHFANGLRILTRLTAGPVFLCSAPDADLPGADVPGVRLETFAGPHPAGLPGTHIHHLAPVSHARTVWQIGYADVIAIGRLFTEGRLWVERVIALGGPAVTRPRLLQTRLGAAIDDLVAGELTGDAVRVISGSVLSGRTAQGPRAFLGRFHAQVSAVSDEVLRPFLGWLGAGLHRFSVLPIFASALTPSRRTYAMTTAAEGGRRAIVPVGSYEKVMPLDLVITPLLKSIASGDADAARELGCLELDEEDLALCGFVCPGKHDFGPLLRDVLTRIEKEG